MKEMTRKILVVSCLNFLLTLVIAGFSELKAQNIPGSALFLTNAKYHLSPVFAGIGNCYELTATGTSGWLNVENAPRTIMLSGHGRLSEAGGFGVQFINDQNGFQSRNIGKFTLAYHVNVSEYRNIFLSFGASGIAKSRKVDVSQFDATDPAVQNLGNGQTTELNAEVGILLRAGQFYANVNFADLFPSQESSLLDEQLQFNQQNLVVYTGYKYFTKSKGLAVEPSLMLHYFNSDRRAEADFDLKVYRYSWSGGDVKTKIWGGINVRNQLEDGFKPLSVTPNAGIFYDQFTFGLGYRAFVADDLLFSPQEFLFSLGYSFGCERRAKCYRWD